MTESFWQHRPFSFSWDETYAPQHVTITLDSSWNLRKVLLHETLFTGASVQATPSFLALTPFAVYRVDWTGAGMDKRRIFGASYRIPSVLTTYTPQGGSSPAFYQVHTAGDLEIGFNQRYNYDQLDGAGAGVVDLVLTTVNSGDSNAQQSGTFLGTLSVLGQRG